MIAAFDVHYLEHDRARAAAVVFSRFDAADPARGYTVELTDIAPYVPGQFYQRELPCLLAVLKKIEEPVHTLIVDSYVQLGNRPGLGVHLQEAVGPGYTIVGVAKSYFEGHTAVELLRGESRQPLYITASGMPAEEAAQHVAAMHGEHRIPTLLKQVDRVARGGTPTG